MEMKAITNFNNKPTRIRHYSDDKKIDYTSKPPSKAPQWCIKKRYNSEQSSNMIHNHEGINIENLKKLMLEVLLIMIKATKLFGFRKANNLVSITFLKTLAKVVKIEILLVSH